MKIALLGYGKMGKAIEEISIERGHSTPLKITSSNIEMLTIEELRRCDVAIEFSKPECAKTNIAKSFAANTPVVVGTTGWYNDFDEIVQLCRETKGTLLTATNFSIGVNLFFAINEKLAQLMRHRKEYGTKIQETHHTEKLDSPSGTAITLAEGITKESTLYQKWINEPTDDNSLLEIISHRETGVPGTHEVIYNSQIDTLSIKHEAKNRKGFALGAVLAAEFITDKTGIFSMKDVLTN